jgi:hypothetical protein
MSDSLMLCVIDPSACWTCIVRTPAGRSSGAALDSVGLLQQVQLLKELGC